MLHVSWIIDVAGIMLQLAAASLVNGTWYISATWSMVHGTWNDEVMTAPPRTAFSVFGDASRAMTLALQAWTLPEGQPQLFY
jgi:hypothetical protein